MPSLVSNNWAGWLLLGIVPFLVSQAIALIRSGWRVTLQRWKKNFGIGILSAIAAYLFLFVWSTVQTVYDDHHDAVSRWQHVVNEKNTLKTGLEDRDGYIKTLESKPFPKCSARASGQGASGQPTQQCWVHELITGPLMANSTNNATHALIPCNYRIEAPYCAGAKFDQDDFSGGGVMPVGGMVLGAGGPGKQGNTFTQCHSGPAVPANQIVDISVQANTKRWVKLQGAWIKSE